MSYPHSVPGHGGGVPHNITQNVLPYQLNSSVDPFLVEALQTLLGRKVVIDTVRGAVRGQLAACHPDHVVLQYHNASFYIRIHQIVWVMPDEPE